MKIKYLKNIGLFLLLGCFFFSCKNKSEAISNFIGKSITVQKGDISVILVSANNCLECTGVLLSKIVANNKNHSYMEGLYYGDSDIDGFQKIKNMTSQFVNWENLNNNKIFIWAAEQTKSKDGPYLLKLKDGVIKEVKILQAAQ